MRRLRSLQERLRSASRNDQRLGRILHGGLSALLGRGFGLVVSAISLPLTVRYLGPERYGIWVTVSTSVVMLSVLDLGIANTLTNFIAEAWSADDRPRAQHYFATAFWLTVLVSLALAGCAAFALRTVDWASLFHLSDQVLAGQARTCVAISVIFFLAQMPLNLANRVLGGYQQAHIANYFAMINSVLGLVAIVTVVLIHGSIVSLMLAWCIAMITGSLVLNLWLLLWSKPWLHPSLGRVRLPMAREMFGQGALFFVLQLTGVVVFNSDNLVITHYLGAAEVTPYSVAWRLTGYASMLQTLFVPALWPAFSEAWFRRDLDWIRKTYRRIMRATLIIVGSAAVVLGFAGRPIIRLWAGQTAVPDHALLWSMCLWAVLLSVTVNQAALMAATRRIQIQTVASVIAACVNLPLSIVLVQRMGALGVILATVASYCVFIVLPQSFEIARILAGRYLTPLPVEVGAEEVLTGGL